MTTPSIKRELEQLIRQSLSLPYVSESCHEQIRTGNHYQSIALGGERTPGFRTPRSEFLDMIDFRGKRVLDLGSNLGEISREARARGAAVVDGFEYDPFFVELAQAINAYNGVTRVSFYQRDITDPSVYVDEYDIVLGLSVFIYMQSVLDRIADMTSGLLVLETHKLTGNLETTYLGPLSRHFPYYARLGESDWGTPHDVEEVRAVLALAKSRSDLLGGLATPVVPRTSIGGSAAPVERSTSVDPGRTPWCDRFFSMFSASSRDDLLDGIERIGVDLDALLLCSDLGSHVMSGWAYWLVYVKGYLEYREAGEATDDNVYVRYMRDLYRRSSHDVGLVAQMDATGGPSRLALRFRDFHDTMTGGNVSPVTLVVREEPPENAKVLHEAGTGAPIAVALIDGYHRLFAARLAGLSAVPAKVVFEQKRELPRVDGEVDALEIAGEDISVSGWIAGGRQAVDGVELWLGETVLARTGAKDERRDGPDGLVDSVAFELTARLQFAEQRASDLRLVATKGWGPVGELPLGRGAAP